MASDSHPELEAEVLSRPPTKRRRAETVPDEIKMDETLYFEDGDVVLMSLPKNHLITAFKVDKVLLRRHSPVFKDMFSLPSPDNVDKHDGVPLVRLQDEADHLVPFLSALYDPSTIPYKRHQGSTVSLVEGTLKLCTKYQIDGLRGRIIDHLSEDWPSNLTMWDLSEKEISGILKLGLMTDISFPEPCSVIQLARECDIPKLLPAAFYHLSRIPPFADFDITHHIDQEAYSDYICGGGRRARFGLLSRDDLMRVFKGSRAITRFVQNLFYTTLEALEHTDSYDHSKRCEESFSRYSKQLEIEVLRTLDPLRVLDISHPESSMPDTMCSYCQELFRECMQEGKSDLWDNLTRFFELKVD